MDGLVIVRIRDSVRSSVASHSPQLGLEHIFYTNWDHELDYSK